MAVIGTRGEKLDLLARQGATLGPVPVRLKAPSGTPIDLTGAIVRAAARKSYTAANSFDMECAIPDPMAGAFQFSMSAIVTASMPTGPSAADPASIYVWDLEIEFPDGTVMPVFYGALKVAPEATR